MSSSNEKYGDVTHSLKGNRGEEIDSVNTGDGAPIKIEATVPNMKALEKIHPLIYKIEDELKTEKIAARIEFTAKFKLG
ncbi:hypothetical protein [Cohnella hashimotonis]|uniref:Uncharacterized protein n=1 Tax=Cohnella hashimotonis TaxID=2826895 RepID=A0ABT6T9M8_9BACL|nr:hypothetical protein [Cohnella hashimotonis]MDI4643526.1 hypothetical protein [Cohnella hashimotonis]